MKTFSFLKRQKVIKSLRQAKGRVIPLSLPSGFWAVAFLIPSWRGKQLLTAFNPMNRYAEKAYNGVIALLSRPDATARRPVRWVYKEVRTSRTLSPAMSGLMTWQALINAIVIDMMVHRYRYS